MALAVAAASAGCSTNAVPDARGGIDASRLPDASRSPDAAGLPDASRSPDAGGPPDASRVPDASHLADAPLGPLAFSSCEWQTLIDCPAPPTSCAARGALPDPACTPGALNPDVTPITIGATICTSGRTATVRPPTTYTEPLKVQMMTAYHVGTDTSAFELDHLVPLELGGAPSDPRNLSQVVDALESMEWLRKSVMSFGVLGPDWWPWKSKCSVRCASPERPSGSSAEPTA
jgi:hypothetical protein